MDDTVYLMDVMFNVVNKRDQILEAETKINFGLDISCHLVKLNGYSLVFINSVVCLCQLRIMYLLLGYNMYLFSEVLRL